MTFAHGMTGALLVVASEARADPVALRGPFDAPALAAGIDGGSISLPAGQFFTVAVEGEWDGQFVGAAAAWRQTLLLSDGLWRVESSLGLGLGTTPFSPDLVISALPALLVSAVGGRGAGGIVLAVPATVAVLAPAVSVPVLIEAQVGLRIGPAWLVARMGAGPVWRDAAAVTWSVRPGLWVAYKGGAEAP